MKKLIFSLAWFGLSQLTHAQELWTLEKSITYAYEHNIQVQQSALDIERADISKDQSWANVFPNLNLNTGYYWTFGKSIDPITNVRIDGDRQTSSLTLSSNWVIFNGLQNYKNIEKAKIDHMAALYNLESMRNDIALQVTSQYLQVMLNKEVKSVAEKQYDISLKQVNRTKQLYEAGTVAKGDLLQAEARLASDDQSIVNAENNENLALLQLAQLLQLGSTEGFDIVVPELDLPDTYLMAITADDIYEQSMGLQPGIKSAELNVESAQSSLAISKGGGMPTLSVQAQVNTNYANTVQSATETAQVYSPNLQYSDPTDPTSDPIIIPQERTVPVALGYKDFGTQFEENINQYIGLNLSIPIFNNFNIKSQVRNSRVQVLNAELGLANEKLQFKADHSKGTCGCQGFVQIVFGCRKSDRVEPGKLGVRAKEKDRRSHERVRLRECSFSIFAVGVKYASGQVRLYIQDQSP